ncbi:putative flippase AglD2 [Methanonatronarchaeum thermophilum]|uniref:Putative flippase AglD2 n=1 Tax=Methanonatronarchaeum thermophilum TaxID=1927129 RepID=A0A1Y3GB39_9EURY|nr:lysylphosphatidylglycerol synthase transmembrane domain-containing protein [Methanonatronarchaeum thermophilum]OUJ18460.1 putative flippase AglD2 [Methanonatronarchaeum thermophilum]
MKPSFNKKIALWILGVSILMGLTVWAGWQELLTALTQTTPQHLTLLLILQLTTTIMIAYQWKYIINKTSNYIDLWKTYLILQAGSFVEMVTPSSKLGGEAAKIYLLRHNTEMEYTDSTAVMLAQKYISLIPFLFITLFFTIIGYIAYGLPRTTFLGLGFLTIIVLTLAALTIWSRYWGEPLRETGEGLIGKALSSLDFLRKASLESSKILTKKDFTYLFTISTAIWILYPIKVWIVGYMLGYEVGIVAITVITYISYLTSLLPLTPGGIGTFEGTMAIFFNITGYTFTEGLAVALVTRLVTYWFPLLISFLASIYISKATEIPILKNKQKKPPNK